MNLGILVSNKKVSFVREDRGVQDIETDGKNLDDILYGANFGFLPRNAKCVVVFCENVSFDSKNVFLDVASRIIGNVNLFVSDVSDVVFVGSYSVPKFEQICLSMNDVESELFIFNKNASPRKSIISAFQNAHTIKSFEENKTLIDCNQYKSVTDGYSEYGVNLSNDMVSIKMVENIVRILLKYKKNIGDQGLITFNDNFLQYADLIQRIEKLINLPIISVSIDFVTVKKYLTESVKNSDVFDYLIKDALIV